VLLLRGPQTPGELRSRTERLHRFDEIGEVLAGLQKLMERDPALATVLPRQPGTKEARYGHLLSGGIESIPAAAYAAPVPISAASASGLEERVERLEATMATVLQQMAALQQKIDDLFGDSAS
jgi:hypothetical protein